MTHQNPVREALAASRFCYLVELVAGRLTREAKLLQVAAQLAQVPGVVAGSITSYAGGSLGHDPVRVGTAARARGLVPNIHITCVGKTASQIRRELEDLAALGIENVFAITGDYPKGAASSGANAKVDFGLDSVQLVGMIAEMRAQGFPFHVSVAVSPFKYTEADCAYQYLKLEKKIAAGADFAITQLGFDARKFRELKQYLAERGLTTPVLGNVYILRARAAEKMSKSEPPGCWVAPELVEKIQAETQAADKGLAAALERAARMTAVVRGLGYAGAYLGGDHDAAHLRWVIERSEALAPRWEELAEELGYAPKGGFYFYGAPAPAAKPAGLMPRLMDAMGRLFPVNKDGWMRDLVAAMMRRIDRTPRAAHALERIEFAVKSPLFGCQACGNCVLGQMEYVCPMTCPKNLRNGPCGGTANGWCEVVPDKPCIWVAVYDRAKAANRVGDLRTYIPPRNRILEGTSSWINYFLNRDSRPGQAQPLVQIAPHGNGQAAAPVKPAEAEAELVARSDR